MDSVILGVDTGGTYTDAVLIQHRGGGVLAHAKALTTYHDLAVGVGEAISGVLSQSAARVCMVALSTTLATNALVEGYGSPVSLLLFGYDPALMRQFGFERALVTDDIAYLPGGHDPAGNERTPFDEPASRQVILARRHQVEAFAISSYFSVRNPAHEQRAKALVEELSGLPVTCGHELTSHLNAVRRATTTALNARLIPMLTDLINDVRRTLDELRIAAPLMIVRGDGGLVSADWAMKRPIETILSGPAASVIGAAHLGGRRDACVVDIGGTTTDIALLHDGRPALSIDGAQVGPWRTMVQAVDAHTVGLGGDSLVTLNQEGSLTIGPRRVIPLCILGSLHPRIADDLAEPFSARDPEFTCQYVTVSGRAAKNLSEGERELLNALGASGPVRLVTLLREHPLMLRRIESLEARRLVLRAGFTPTDALHVSGRYTDWNASASRAGAVQLAGALGETAEALCQHIALTVSEQIATEITSLILTDEGAPGGLPAGSVSDALLDRALGHAPESLLGCTLTLRTPIVAIGAPAWAYVPRAGEVLNTPVDIPPHASVANAVGAAVGSVVQQVRAVLQPVNGSQWVRLHLPEGVQDFTSIDEGVEYAYRTVPAQVRDMAHLAGADGTEVHIDREDRFAPVSGGWGTVYVGTELTFTAIGRPRTSTVS